MKPLQRWLNSLKVISHKSGSLPVRPGRAASVTVPFLQSRTNNRRPPPPLRPPRPRHTSWPGRDHGPTGRPALTECSVGGGSRAAIYSLYQTGAADFLKTKWLAEMKYTGTSRQPLWQWFTTVLAGHLYLRWNTAYGEQWIKREKLLKSVQL